MILVIAGTRPELIKLSPVVLELRRRGIEHMFASTGQHSIAEPPWPGAAAPDTILAGPKQGTSLPGQFAHIFSALAAKMPCWKPSAVVVQGDTTSVLVGAQAAFMAGVPVLHVEAGLRSGRLYDPYPEEAYRQLVSKLATVNCAPTLRAARTLMHEKVPGRITVTGNTVTDSLRLALPHATWPIGLPGPEGKMILATCHRRENWGKGARELRSVLASLADEYQEPVTVYVVVHPNPLASAPFTEEAHPRIIVVPPQPYPSMLALLQRANAIVTDSGGLMEEAVTLGRQVCIYRRTTERQEAVEAGAARLDENLGNVYHILTAMLDGHHACRPCRGVFGDGHAAERIVDELMEWV